MKAPAEQHRCAIYTRKSSEDGLEQSFNSLHAQREACEAYIKSQQHEGWRTLSTEYDDGGYSGGTMERPGLAQLLEDVRAGKIDVVVVYKVDRLSRSLADFMRIVESFEKHQVSFVSVTQHFNTSSSMGRLTLNVLLSFAQFEREVTGERIRDKIAASKMKGMWMGGVVPIGYDVIEKNLVVNPEEAETVRHIYRKYLEMGCVRKLKAEVDRGGHISKKRSSEKGGLTGGTSFGRGALYTLLKNPLYIGKIRHGEKLFEALHQPIIDLDLWNRVQTKLAENRNHRITKTDVKNPSLLAGLLFDDTGNPMSPTYSTKGGRRYCYYISQALLRFREQKTGSVLRVAAQEIEEPITQRLLILFASPTELRNAIGLELSTDKLQELLVKAKLIGQRWDSLTPQGRIRYLKTWIEKIVVSKTEIQIEISRDGLRESFDADPNVSEYRKTASSFTPTTYVVTIPVTLRCRGLEPKLIITAGKQPLADHATVHTLQTLLGKALAWNQALLSGEVHSTREIAKREQVTQRYIARILRLAYLAPHQMKAIIAGEIPMGLNIDRFRRELPLDWSAQDKLYRS